MAKKFLVSVADVYGYDSSENLLFIGKTLLDSSIETSLNATDVRAGRGAALQYVYYNSPDMNITITESQFNLDFIAANLGSSIVTGNNVYTEETVTLVANAGSVTGTPLSPTGGAVIYGWVTRPNGVVEKVTFTGSAYTAAGAGATDTVCVRYYAVDSASRSVTLNANVIPTIVRLVLEAQLASSDENTNIIGSVQIIVPRATLTGAFSISLTPDGDTTYVESSNVGDIDYYNLSTFTTSGKVFNLVWNEIRARGTSGSENIALRIKTGGSEYASSTKTLTASFTRVTGTEYTQNPQTAADWAGADFANLQTGQEVIA